MNLDNFLKSGFNFSHEEYELKLEYLLHNIILSIVIIMLIILSFIRFMQENYLQSFMDFVVILISLYTIYYIRKSKSHAKKIVHTILFIFFILISFSFFKTNMYITGTSWFIVLLMPAFYLGGLKTGVGVTFISTLSIILLGNIVENPYNILECIYALIPMLMASVFIYVYEKRVIIAKKLLIQKNIQLTKEVEVKTAEELILIQNNKELGDVISNSNIELYIVDYERNRYLYVNQGGLNALGYTLEEMLTMSVFDINPSLSMELVDKLKEIGKKTSNTMNITTHQKKDGSTYGVQSLIHRIIFQGKEAYAIYDINLNDQQQAQKQLLAQKDKLLQQAYYDQLTKLPNRTLFNDRLQQAIAKAKRSKKEFAIVFIDLDRFKEINDTHGHKIGDSVLCEIASRFKQILRQEDTISRFGGDEFVCIIEQLSSTVSISNLVSKLITKIKEPIIVGEHQLYLTCSIGISIYPRDTQDETMLLHMADTAMYKAKDAGKDNYKYYA